MAGDVTWLEAARTARNAEPPPEAALRRSRAAQRYLRRAEEALALLPHLSTIDEKTAVCRITEAWLGLAEDQLARPQDMA